MDNAPNAFLTSYVVNCIWTLQQAEEYVCEHGNPMWRVSRAELRASLGFTVYARSAYRHRVNLIAVNLYMAGNQRTARELVRFLASGGTYTLRPIDPRRRWWSRADQQILDALF
jgi:hypothetical protein